MYYVFFDASCSFCQQAIASLQRWDKRKILQFADLSSTQAQALGIQGRQSLVFYDHGRIYFGGQGILKIFWRLGGRYRLLGIFSFLPAWISAPFYYYVARRRHHWS